MGNVVHNDGSSVKEKQNFDSFENLVSLRNMPDSYFVYGKRIRVINNLDYVKFVQGSCGGWDSDMAECINQICVILRVDHDKMIIVKSPSRRKWLFNRAALEPINEDDFETLISCTMAPSLMNSSTLNSSRTGVSPQKCISETIAKPQENKQNNSDIKEFKVGEIFLVSSNEKLVQEKQQDCGGYSKLRMKDLIGKLVKVKYYNGKYVKIEKDGRDYDLHPDILDYPNPEYNTEQPTENQNEEVTSDNIQKRSAELFLAISEGSVEKLYEVIDFDILNIQNNCGMTPINEACCLGKMEIVEALIQFGVDINLFPDHNGNFPIHNCTIHGQIQIFKFLIEKFPDNLNKKTTNGQSLLDIAKQLKDKEFEKYLLSKNCQKNSVIQQILQDSQSTRVENECTICRDGVMNIAFLCGHLACKSCADRLVKCHICKAEIQGKVTVYL